jgi:glycosyltransferase involved in cell wall biosynthesis
LERPDVIVSTSPQFFCGLAGLPTKWIRRVPWVLEVRDLWPESIVSVGAMRKGVAIRFLEALERLAYRRADRIVAVTDSFVAHIAARCQGPDKIDVIKNGVDLGLFRKGADANAVKRRFGFAGRTVAAYVGTHGMAHGLDTVIEAAKRLQHDSRIGFLLVGDGSERARLAEKVSALGLDNVRVAGQLPKSEMPAIWAATDISLILLRKSDTFTKVLPSKMFEAMAMECPIVLGVEGEAATLLEKAGAGIAIEPENVEDLMKAVLRLTDGRARAAELGRNGGRHVREHYDRCKLAARYLEMLDQIVASYAARRPHIEAAGRSGVRP